MSTNKNEGESPDEEIDAETQAFIDGLEQDQDFVSEMSNDDDDDAEDEESGPAQFGSSDLDLLAEAKGEDNLAEELKRRLISRGFSEDELDVQFPTPKALIDFYKESMKLYSEGYIDGDGEVPEESDDEYDVPTEQDSAEATEEKPMSIADLIRLREAREAQAKSEEEED